MTTSAANPVCSVLLWGAGNFGSRWLQGLLKWPSALQIDVFDVSTLAVASAQTRLGEVAGAVKHQVNFFTNKAGHAKQYDLVVVATTADVRCQVVEYLAASVAANYWILEKVLAQSLEQVQRIVAALQGQQVWVNASRRRWHWYQNLKASYPIADGCDIVIQGGPWDLIGNAVHYLDLIAWWSGADLHSIQAEQLDANWQLSGTRNKAGQTKFYTTSGILQAKLSKDISVRFEWQQSDDVNIIFRQAMGALQITELAGVALSDLTGKVCGSIEHQSENTCAMLAALIQRQNLVAPTLAESAAIHSLLLEALLPAWRAFKGSTDDVVPIS